MDYKGYKVSVKVLKAGKLSIKVTSILLSGLDAGLRIEIRRFSSKINPSPTYEIELLRGDDKLLLKSSYEKTVFKSPTKQDIDDTVNKYIQHAKDNNWID